MLDSMRRVWPLALLLVVGCAKGDGDSNPKPSGEVKTDPAVAVYDQLRSGFVQIGNSQEILGEALTTADSGRSSSDKALSEGCKEIHDLLDSAGSYLSDYTEAPATFEEFNAKFAEWDDARLKAIVAANDSLHEVGEARGIIEGFFNDPVLEKEQVVIDLRDLLTEADKNLREAIITLGGKVEES
jgi:hypothetical protein